MAFFNGDAKTVLKLDAQAVVGDTGRIPGFSNNN